MPSLISNTLSVLGGAAVGAAAMYLLDPDLGQDRRQDVAGTASDAVSATGQAVRSTVGGASDSAHSVANTISKYAKGLAGTVSDKAGDAVDSVSDAVASTRKAAKAKAGDASDSAHSVAETIANYAKSLATRLSGHASDAADTLSDSADGAVSAVKSAHAQTKARAAGAVSSAKSAGMGWVSKAQSTKDDWLDSASDLLDRAKSKGRKAVAPEPHPVATATGVTLGSIGVLALGAGVMYYMDPERGRTRRALLRDKAYSITRQSGDKARRYGHHLGNKAQGYVAQARQVVPEQWVDKAKAMMPGDGSSAANH